MTRFALPMLVCLLVVAGCGPNVPERFRASYDAIKREVEEAEASYTRDRREWQLRMQVTSAYAVASPLMGAPDMMKDAEAKLKSARGLLRGELVTAAKMETADGPVKYREVGAKIDDLLEDAEELYRRPVQAFDLANKFLADRSAARIEYGDLIKTARGKEGKLAGDARAAQKTYPAKKDDLEARLSAYRTSMEKAEEAIKELSDAAQAAQFTVDLEKADRFAMDAKEQSIDLARRIDQLGRSYTKTLIDMRADYDVVFGRSSWSSVSDYDKEASFTYPPRRLTLVEYARVAKDLERNYSESEAAVMGLDVTTGRSSSHDQAEFWVEDTSSAYFHGYMITENGQSRESGWQPVDPSYFSNNLENLGMDVLSKPKGVYEEDALMVPMPPGFAYVNNPRCGRWVNRPEGQVWDWNDRCGGYRGYYGRWYPYSYIFFGDWRRWNTGMKGRTPYYGPNNVYGTYGSAGSATFRGTNWGQYGSLNRKDPSLRGLAGAWRGGGPGGGGK